MLIFFSSDTIVLHSVYVDVAQIYTGGTINMIWGGYDCRLLKIIRLFCTISSLLLGSFAKIKRCNLKEATNHSHPIRQVIIMIR